MDIARTGKTCRVVAVLLLMFVGVQHAIWFIRGLVWSLSNPYAYIDEGNTAGIIPWLWFLGGMAFGFILLWFGSYLKSRVKGTPP
jgi:hypothetical protein